MKALVQDDIHHGLRIAPLVDIVFLLLVFFLVATTFYDDERDLAISLSVAKEGAERASDHVTVINVREGGEILIHGRTVALEGLLATLKDLGTSSAPPAVVIRCDAQASHDAFVRVLEACHESGVRDVSVATRSRE